MNPALSAPFLAAAGVLCVSGAAKLRAPGPTRQAFALLGLLARRGLVRVLGGAELALGVAGIVAPGTATALTLGLAYGAFAAVAMRLVALRASCGCFGETDAAASPVQALLSAALAGVGVAATVWSPGGAAWVLHRPVAQAATLALGIAGCVYGLVIAYTQLPGAWDAWSVP